MPSLTSLEQKQYTLLKQAFEKEKVNLQEFLKHLTAVGYPPLPSADDMIVFLEENEEYEKNNFQSACGNLIFRQSELLIECEHNTFEMVHWVKENQALWDALKKIGGKGFIRSISLKEKGGIFFETNITIEQAADSIFELKTAARSKYVFLNHYYFVFSPGLSKEYLRYPRMKLMDSWYVEI